MSNNIQNKNVRIIFLSIITKNLEKNPALLLQDVNCFIGFNPFMSQPKKFIKKPSKLYRSLVTTLLIANGIFQLIVPALAEGTKAGESISNTATATYEDPLDPGTKINTTSNTVVVTVAEVAGITVTASGVTDSTPATPVSAEYLSPGIDATIKYPGIKCDGSNTNGAIVVKLGNLPNATAPGIPASS